VFFDIILIFFEGEKSFLIILKIVVTEFVTVKSGDMVAIVVKNKSLCYYKKIYIILVATTRKIKINQNKSLG